MQLRPDVGAQPDDVAGIGGYLRLVQDYIKHV